MDYPKKLVALSAGDHKQAALFFDELLPLHSLDTVPRQLWAPVMDLEEDTLLGDIARTALDEVPLTALRRAIEHEDPETFQKFEFWKWVAELPKTKGIPPELRKEVEIFIKKLPDNEATLLLKDFPAFARRYRDEFTAKYMVQAISSSEQRVVFVPFLSSRGSQYEVLCSGKEESVELTFANVRLVDTSHADWDQLLEIKRDSDMMHKLRNFKLLLYDDYTGKSRAYARDCIDKKIEEYEEACRKHGFEMFTSSVTSLLDSKSLLGATALAAAGILSGNPEIVSASALAGAAIETSKILINLAVRSSHHHVFRKNHEVAYVMDARRRLEKS